MRKINITTKKISESDKAAKVNVKVTYIDLKAAKPGTETKERTFEFALKGFLWMPVDSRDFGNQIESMISGQ